MKVVSTIARILLGLVFTLAGVMPVFVHTPPPQPGMTGVVTTALYQSHWIYFIAFAQFVVGILLLTNRLIPLALILLGAFLYNSFAFHLTTAPPTAIVPLVVTLLWVIVALPYRVPFLDFIASRAAS